MGPARGRAAYSVLTGEGPGPHVGVDVVPGPFEGGTPHPGVQVQHPSLTSLPSCYLHVGGKLGAQMQHHLLVLCPWHSQDGLRLHVEVLLALHVYLSWGHKWHSVVPAGKGTEGRTLVKTPSCFLSALPWTVFYHAAPRGASQL